MTATIQTLRVHRVALPLIRPFVTAVRSTNRMDTVIVEAVDSDGRSGWGEAAVSWRVTGQSLQSITAVVHGPFLQTVRGRVVSDLTVLCDDLARSAVHNEAARSAVECALHDLAAQQVGIPPFQLLGAGPTAAGLPTTATDMTLSATADIDGLVAAACEQVAAEFTTLKVKAGIRDDVKALAEVRAAVGSDIVLRVDANQAWQPKQAVAVIRQWEDLGLGIQFVEQPVAAQSFDALAWVTDRVETPIVADESVWSAHDLLEVLRRRAADVVNIKLAKTGGLREAARLLAVAQASDVGVLVGCMMESRVGISAAASFVASAGAATGVARAWGARVSDTVHDLDAGLWIDASAVRGGAEYDGRRITPSVEAGLGIRGVESDTVFEADS